MFLFWLLPLEKAEDTECCCRRCWILLNVFYASIFGRGPKKNIPRISSLICFLCSAWFFIFICCARVIKLKFCLSSEAQVGRWPLINIYSYYSYLIYF